MNRTVLAGTLRSRGFPVVFPLKGTSHCEIFCVRETTEPDAEAYVAKVVSLTGLDAKGRASAQQEVSLLKGLAAHPNLIAYRESFLEDAGGAGILFIVMSLAEDGDLRRVVTDFTPTPTKPALAPSIPEAVVLSWMRQTLSGLSHLHGQGVVHRDLKSSNIFLCNQRRRIRIGDFGISRVLESTRFAVSCVGTPAYMSPELMRNERYDVGVDMWALGCICYELCCLSLPFMASSLLDLVFQVVETEPDWAKWTGGHSEDLREVTSRLLAKDINMRPSADDVLREPLFNGGRGAMDPAEQDWAVVAPRLELTGGSPDKGLRETTPSELTTADNCAKSSLSSGGADSSWMTPGMAWVADSLCEDVDPSGQSTGAASLERLGGGSAIEFERQLHAAREAERSMSRDEFQVLLTTHHDRLKDELAAAAAGLPTPPPDAVARTAHAPAPPPNPVLETVM
eukprot:TRINITY_DN103489_c0_g1_i1.p1 TRINITY_DN103489_c0_g1~~TRINITY_DN103489_c0_g1_i1.p1  ORF type:complete len:454 (-),score=75.82 TRINITY_DN103489_c0_g1_i1:319-1680(-)